SGNYMDVGCLGGVKKGDVFVVFTPHGEPVGFVRVVETQQYTSSFDFIEMTVEPNDHLTVKKVNQEIKSRLPEDLVVFPEGKRWPKAAKAAKKTMPGATTPGTTTAPAAGPDNSLPPLPGETAPAAGNNNSGLPALPGMNDAGNGMPALPEVNPSGSG